MSVKYPILSGGGSTVDTDAQAFLDATGITDGTISSAIDTLVKGLKTSGLWFKMLAVYPFVGDSATTNKYNLKNPQDTDEAYRLTFSGTLTHVNGCFPNGTTGIANTHLNPYQNIGGVTNHISFYSLQNVTTGTDQIDMGGAIASQTLWLSTDYGASGLNDKFLSRNTSTTTLSSYNNANGSGFYLSTKTANAVNGFKTYKSGLEVTSDTGSQTNPDINFYLFCLNNSGSANYHTNRGCGFASIGSALDATEASDLYTLVQAFNTSLSREV